MLAQLLFLASSVMVVNPRIENAVTIHTATRDYLQFDIAPMEPCRRLMVSGPTLRSPRTAVVQWSVLGSIVDTTCQEKTKRANILLPFPDTVGGAHGAVLVDSIVNSWGDAATSIGRVTNPAPPMMCPMVKCAAPDSAAAFKTVQARIEASTFLATFTPYYVESFLPISPWTRTKGMENFPEVAVPLPGNAGNWIDADVVDLRMDSLVAGRVASTCDSGIVCPLLVVNPNVQLMTGPVQYFYQQATDPSKSDTSRSGDPFVQDTVLKMGSNLHLAGYVRHDCGGTLVDSQLVKETRWLVATNGSRTDSLAAAFTLPVFCGFTRPGAWPVRDGKVEITQGIWVPLRDLVGATGVSPASTRVSGATLRRVGREAILELPASACVRAIDVSGREILPSTLFAAGRRALRLPPGHGMLFVQIRSGLSTLTIPLEPAP